MAPGTLRPFMPLGEVVVRSLEQAKSEEVVRALEFVLARVIMPNADCEKILQAYVAACNRVGRLPDAVVVESIRYQSEKVDNGPHPSHAIASTFDTSRSYDYKSCMNCEATDDVPGKWGALAYPCLNPPDQSDEADETAED